MDPASLALGVVSLAMQLVQTTGAVKNLISAYKSAAKELDDLSDKLDDIEIICHSLEVILSNAENPTRRYWEISLLRKLHCVIHGCYGKVTNILDVIRRIASKHKKGRNPLRSVGSLFLQYRQQIRTCTVELDRSLSSLQLCMTANILAVSLRPTQVSHQPCAFTTCVPNTRRNPIEIKIDPFNSAAQPCASEVVVEHWRHGWTALAYLQKTRKLKTIPGAANLNYSSTQDESTLTFGSPLLNLYIKLSVRCGSLAPFCVALQLPRVISFYRGPNDLGIRVKSAFDSDDLKTVQRLFGERQLTPATIVTWIDYDPESETSLLGLAAMTRSKHLLKFLANQTSNLDERNHLPYHSFSYRLLKSDDQLSSALQYINLRRRFITPRELRSLLIGVDNCHDVKSCVEVCRQHFPNDWEPFNITVWSHIIMIFSKPQSTESLDQSGWADLVTDAVSQGLDLHCEHQLGTGLSVLSQILHAQRCSDESLESIHRWVDMLELAGVNVEQYLQIETERCFDAGHQTASWLQGPDHHFSSYQRILVVKHSRGRRIPYWIETIDDTCPVRDLLVELPYLRHWDTLYFRMEAIDTMRYCQAWKNGQTLDLSDPSMMSWPICPPLQPGPVYPRPSWWIKSEGRRLAEEWVNHACSLMQSRFERKQMRKLRKINQEKEPREQNLMPGTWVDDA